jgi:hypothetical protein
MTRVLYWNINNFTTRKLFRPAPPQESLEAQDRFFHIVNQVIAPHAPDVIVVVEVYDRTREVGYQGVPLRTGGNAGHAVLMLLNQLRTIDDRWCCVPPVNLGDFGFREAVAVFFNAASLYFEGPYVLSLPNAASFRRARPANLANVGTLTNYSALWADALPSPLNIEPNLQRAHTWNDGNGAVSEVESAAQWEFYDDNNTRLDWPGAQNRSPCYTRFREVGGANRVLKIFAIHTSPATAAAATYAIPQIQELPAAAGEVSLVIGDFNVDTFGTAVGAYVPLDGTHDMLLDPRDPVSNNITPARKPYLMTHMLPPTRTNQTTGVVTQIATPFNTTGWAAPDPQHNVYPRYGYMGSIIVGVSDSGAIDNAFVSYPVGAAIPAHNTTIVNTVVGKPYAGPLGTDPALTGGLAYPTTLATAIPAGGQNPPPAVAPQVDTIQFTHWNNLKRIYSTSDHLALVVDV